MSRHLALAVLVLTSLTVGCAGPPKLVLDVTSEPAGAKIFLSRRGEKAYRAGFGPVDGDVRSDALNEDFLLLGMSPLVYTSPLEEMESGGTVLGLGGGVVRKYLDGVLRIEKEGFETAERHMRFQDGKVTIHVKLEKKANEPQP